MQIPFKEYLKNISQDAILWQAMQYWTIASSSTILQDSSIQAVVELVTCISSESKRDVYIKSISGEVANYNAGIKRKCDDLQKKIKSLDKKKAKDTIQESIDLIRKEIDALLSEHETLENSYLPELTQRELKKYVSQALEQKEKNKKDKQRTIFDSTGDHNSDLDDDENDPWQKCPKWINPEEVKTHGFTMVEDSKDGKLKRYGYYSYNPNEKTHEERQLLQCLNLLWLVWWIRLS